MTLTDLLLTPFQDYLFMRRALFACLALSLAGAPLGVLLLLRRMSLVGDSMSHAILPGAAIGYWVGGFSLPFLTGGGLVAGLAVALFSGWVSERTRLREDSSFAAFYLLSLALGVLLISQHGTQIDLVHILFGNLLSIDEASLNLILGISIFSLSVFLIFSRVIVLEAFERNFLLTMGIRPTRIHFLFLILVVLALLAAFQSMGTLLAVGLMIIPAAASRLLTSHLRGMILISALMAVAASLVGLLLSYHLGWPSGPAIVLVCGMFYAFAIIQDQWRGRA